MVLTLFEPHMPLHNPPALVRHRDVASVDYETFPIMRLPRLICISTGPRRLVKNWMNVD
jgi:hypothetical protein